MTSPDLAAEEPRTYPLVLRTQRYGWWQPITGLILTPIAMFIIGPLVALSVVAVAVTFDQQGSFSTTFDRAVKLQPVTWQGLLYLNLSLAWLVVAMSILVRFVHGVSPRWLMSVRPGIRWRFFWACFGLAVVAIGVQLLLGLVLPDDLNGLHGSPNKITGALVAMGLVVLLTTPFQAMGEEFVFRGYLTQAFGALTRNPWIAVALSSLLFALAHGVQNAPLFLDRLTFGLMAGYLVVRTGGLEAGIALHVWNNLFAFGLALGFGNINDTLHVTEISWWNIPLTFTQNGIYVLLVLWVANRMGITSRTTRPVLPLTTQPV